MLVSVLKLEVFCYQPDINVLTEVMIQNRQFKNVFFFFLIAFANTFTLTLSLNVINIIPGNLQISEIRLQTVHVQV